MSCSSVLVRTFVHCIGQTDRGIIHDYDKMSYINQIKLINRLSRPLEMFRRIPYRGTILIELGVIRKLLRGWVESGIMYARPTILRPYTANNNI